jgi:hypothetical protein
MRNLRFAKALNQTRTCDPDGEGLIDPSSAIVRTVLKVGLMTWQQALDAEQT